MILFISVKKGKNECPYHHRRRRPIRKDDEEEEEGFVIFLLPFKRFRWQFSFLLVRVGSWDEFESQLKRKNRKLSLMPEWLLLLFLFICMLQISFLSDNDRLLNEKRQFQVRSGDHLLVHEHRDSHRQIKEIFFLLTFRLKMLEKSWTKRRIGKFSSDEIK